MADKENYYIPVEGKLVEVESADGDIIDVVVE